MNGYKSLDLQPLPRWTGWQGGLAASASEAAFAAGAALLALDQILRADPPWIGAWRMRQALAAAAASARLLRCREDECALRDAHHLTRPGDDPGPAGRFYRAWREMSGRRARLDSASVDRVARGVGVAIAPGVLESFGNGPGECGPVTMAAETAARVSAVTALAERSEGEVAGLMLADVALAQHLGWPSLLPLLATTIFLPAFKRSSGRRVRPGDPGWAEISHAAYARAAVEAHARAVDLHRRAERLLVVAGQVRTRAGTEGVAALLADDAVAAAELTALGSDRAARRFLERLAALGSIRELTGRSAFRLYGL